MAAIESEAPKMKKALVVVGTLLSILFVFIVFPVAYWYVSRLVDRGIGIPAGTVSMAVSYILTGLSWSVGLFWILWSYSYLIFVGSGSPVEAFGVALEPTTKLVTAGPYAYVRNPLVFGFLFILLGVAFLANSLSGIAMVPLVGLIIATYLRLFEEKELKRRFGEAYEHYRHYVPMIVPRFNPYAPQAKMA